jgi:hypothetical protein
MNKKTGSCTCACRFSVCGQVIIDKVPSGLERVSAQQTVKVTGTEEKQVSTKEDGKFCLNLKPGKYVFSVSFLRVGVTRIDTYLDSTPVPNYTKMGVESMYRN